MLSDEETSPQIRELGEQLRERIQTESGRLHVETTGDSEGAQVTLDSEPLDAGWLARDIPVAPGNHTVAATREGRPVAEAEVAVHAGETARVRLDLGTAATGGRQQPTGEVPLLEDWRFWLGVGGGTVAVIVLVAVIAAVASSGSSDAIPGNFMPAVITW